MTPDQTTPEETQQSGGKASPSLACSARSLLESAANLFRDSVSPKIGEEDVVADWLTDYEDFLRQNSRVDASEPKRG